jgi:Fe-S cluster biogenesis protein NfuA
MSDPAETVEAGGPADLRAAADRIEVVLDGLRERLELRDWSAVEEVVRLVTDLYGAGLGRLIELADEVLGASAAGVELVDRLLADELVASLLVVHGLHPDDLATRIEQALDGVRPYLASHGGDVQLVGVVEEEGLLRLRLLGSCDGCPSSSETLRSAVREAIFEQVPEIVAIDTEGAVAEPERGAVGPVPVPLGPRPERV